MADMIARVNGQDSFAYRGAPGWHGKGQTIQATDTLEQIQEKAGLLYNINRGRVRYAVDPKAPPSQLRPVPDKVVLFRDDTGAPLGIVSDSYQIVQPAQVLEFFREWAQLGGAQIETAGALFGGARYFVTAKIADAVRDVGNGDLLVPYIFGETSADGSLATSFKETSVRVVCDNTAQIARFGGATHRTTHRSVWKAADARAAIENAVKDFGAYVEAARALARAKLDAAKVDELTAKLLADGDVEAAKAKRAFGKILELFNGSGAGSHLSTSNGTAWGWYNAVTDYVDHAARAQSDEHRFASAQSGPGAKMKDAALDIAMTTV